MRLDHLGAIDRSMPVNFEFDGVAYSGFAGDTLASALLANGVKLTGRSFKYHRPRGIFTIGSAEPNAMITLIEGAQRTPNLRASMIEIYEGIRAFSQNNWPSLRHDVMAINDVFSPFLGAGFYYKTFMWPRKFWEKIYEPVIRRAAGLGSLATEPDQSVSEKAFAHCDLLVIGGGPAGLLAARTAARAGLDVILADEDTTLGGRLLYEQEEIDDAPASLWLQKLLIELRALPNVRLMTRTTVTGLYDGGTFSALERVSLHMQPAGDLPRECFWRIVAKHAILAAGALERPIAFANNDRPGIMLANAVRGYVNRFGVVPGLKVSIFANNDDARRTAHDLMAAGVNVVAILDSRADAPSAENCPVYLKVEILNTEGRHGLTHLRFRHAAGEAYLATDCLGLSGGWNPSLHLACHMNGRPAWNDAIAAFVPSVDMVAGLTTAGAAAGVFSTLGAMRSGQDAALAALISLKVKAPAKSKLRLPDADDATYRITPLWAQKSDTRAWVDLANDVTTKDIDLAVQEGFISVEHMKRYTTQGMAPDQGKSANVLALAYLADTSGREIAQTGTTTFRPPFAPQSIGAMGAGGQKKGFAPERFLTSHAASVSLGAPMIEAGLWYRPSYFPQKGETTWRETCDREVGLVRSAVGVCDVSTLGKIDIQGQDAARFLDFIYTNTMSTLPEGRVRYGIMLREDGHVLDDGTTAHLGPNHYLMTTTTSAASQVMRHLDFVHQAYCADWDLSTISVTENWAQFAIAGPKARALIESLSGQPINLSFMGFVNLQLSEIVARVFRISFSGEESYELAVPARYGASLWNKLIVLAKTYEGGPYGMEALNVLRIEKGLLTHAEMHGRVTAFDLGLSSKMSSKKDFIGRAAAGRAGLLGPGREELVGLIAPVGHTISAGAHLYPTDKAPVRENDQGYVTSACYSPTLGRYLALAFLRDGREKQGQEIRLVDHLRDLDVRCQVENPVFYDNTGERLRG